MQKKRFFAASLFGAILVSFVAAAPIFAQDAAKSAPFEAPALQQEGGWTLVVVPDPQTYVKFARNQGAFDMQIAWIAENIEKLNIRQVLCTGDLVEMNGITEPDGVNGNQTSAQMWGATSRAFERLDGVLPYVLCTGNHDYGVRSAENRDSKLNDYFPVDRNPALGGVLVETFENAAGQKTLENAAYEFEGTDGQKILTVALEFAPRPETLDWAKNLFASPKFADHFGIVLTHSYLHSRNNGSKRIDKEGYQLNKDGGAPGEEIWKKLVEPSQNIRLVVCGHISAANDMNGSVGFSVDKNSAGKDVAQLLFDVQALGGGWHGNGGDGWLQLLEFSKDMTTVKVRTFSPLFAISPTTQKEAWNRSEGCEFEFKLEP